MDEKLYDNYTQLAQAVIEMTCKEYKAAYKSNNKGKMKQLENWFRGPEFELYTRGKIDPEYFIEKLQEDAYVRRDRKRVDKGWHRKDINENN